MRDPVSLKILDRFRTLFERLGCDYPLLRKILEVKLTMDARRVPTVIRGNRRSRRDDEDKNSFLRSLWVYALMGLITLPFVMMDKSYVFQMSITFGILMFLIMTSMISDFSSVLLDIRDRVIISTKPVPARTVNWARTLHIIIYLSLVTGVLAGPALIGGLIRHGVLFFLLLLLMVIFLDGFVLVITALLYLFILNFFDGERLKDMINYVQILLSLTILVGYQLVAHSFDVFKLNIVFHAAWWQVFVPPIWFGSVFAWLQDTKLTAQVITFSVLAIIVPCVLFLVYIRVMPVFERKLQKLAAEGSSARNRGSRWQQFAARVICRSEEERAFFTFSSLMMTREREFKLKIYPSLGFSMAFPFILLFNSAVSSHGFRGLASSRWYLSIYMIAIMIPTVIMMLKFSGKYKAAWVYKATPIQAIAAVYRGAIKAFLVRLLLPVFLVEAIIFTFIFGIHVVPQMIAAGLSLLLYTVLCFWLTGKDFPFSRPFQAVQQSNRIVGMVLLLFIGLLVGVHVVFTLIPYGIYIYLPVLLGLNVLAWTIGFRTARSRRVNLPSGL